jgi:hypothetical protein
VEFIEKDRSEKLSEEITDAKLAAAPARSAARQPAELAAAMGETRQLRELVTDILGVFGPSGSGMTARVGREQIRKWRTRAGLED